MKPLLGIIAGIALQMIPGEAAITSGPILQNAKETEITILWESNKGEGFTVRYGKIDDKNSDTIFVKPSKPILHSRKEGKSVVEFYWYEPRLKNLRPAQKYWYEVVAEGGETKRGSFRTFPSKPEKFKFIVYGDSRWGLPASRKQHKELVANFLRHEPAFIISTGDIVGNGENYGEWKAMFFDPLADVINHVPIYVAMGNHDGRGQDFRTFLRMPGDGVAYYFNYGNALFVCLPYGGYGSKEVVNKIRQKLSAGLAYPWKFAFFHYPIFNINRHGSSRHRAWLPLFHKAGVDMTFAGHSHLYERFFPLKSEKYGRPMTHIITGNGGVGIPGGKWKPVSHPYLARFADACHYVVITIDGLKLFAEVFDGLKKVKIDEFGFEQTEGVYDKAYMGLSKSEEHLQLQTAIRSCVVRFCRRLQKGQTNELELKSDTLPLDSDFWTGNRENIEMEIVISPESSEYYKMEPIVSKANKRTRKFETKRTKITPLVEVRMDKSPRWGKCIPPLRLDVSFSSGKLKGKVKKQVAYPWDIKE